MSPALAGRFLTTGSPREVQVDILVLSPSFILDLSSIPPSPHFSFFLIDHHDWKQIRWFIFQKGDCLQLQQLESSVKESGQSWAGLPG